MPSNCPSLSGVLEYLGEEEWGDLLLRVAAGGTLWVLSAIWLAVPVGVMRGRGAAIRFFCGSDEPSQGPPGPTPKVPYGTCWSRRWAGEAAQLPQDLITKGRHILVWELSLSSVEQLNQLGQNPRVRCMGIEDFDFELQVCSVTVKLKWLVSSKAYSYVFHFITKIYFLYISLYLNILSIFC